MHDTNVVMKDGRVFCGPIYLFRPEDGYLTLMLDPNHYDYEVPDKLYFRDMKSAVTENERVNIRQVGVDCDELQRARDTGWDGS